MADVLRIPLVGPFLRWRHARASLQVATLAVAAVIVVDGLFGPDLAPKNLATVLTWIHSRGLLIVGILGLANVFCAACPFVLTRDLGRRLHRPTRRFPPWLRGKWLGLALLGLVFLAYEAFDLWATPRGTALLLLCYFATILGVDLVFQGASFCKHVCPIGQWNFVASTLSPLEVKVREAATCATCRTHDCIRGRREPAPARAVTQRGCELGLFLPGKVGNLDCTFCLDCVHACPHDNVAIATRLPAEELSVAGRRSGLRRIETRADYAALAAVFTFAALLNAFAMTGPSYAVEAALARATGVHAELPILIALFAVGLAGLPLVATYAAAAATRAATRTPLSLRALAVRYAWCLVPLGAGVWLAHYSFHFLTGLLTVVPVTQSAVADVTGRALLGTPLWTWVGLKPGSVFPVEIGSVVLGAFGSLAVAWQISQRDHGERAGAAAAPWFALVVLVATAALAILSQPMEMRGTFL